MTAVSTPGAPPLSAPAPTEAKAAERKLAPNALGLPQVLFCIVTGAAPLAAMMFNFPIAVYGGGSGAPAAFLIATVVLTIFSVGYKYLPYFVLIMFLGGMAYALVLKSKSKDVYDEIGSFEHAEATA